MEKKDFKIVFEKEFSRDGFNTIGVKYYVEEDKLIIDPGTSRHNIILPFLEFKELLLSFERSSPDGSAQ